jgi:S-adenosyl-L-methionine hydrolase (adenosine-forming)
MRETGRGPGQRTSRITILTDFGTGDGYVAAMKGVICAVAPGVAVDDATHEVPPGDILAGAWALAAYWQHYPAGTVHVAVVDPGVGGDRRAIAIEAAGRFGVGPDNGIFTRVLREAGPGQHTAVEVRPPATASATFHGRDVFAPAAARIALAGSLDGLGPAVADPLLLPVPEASHADGVVLGEVVHVDRFGNLITNIGRELLPASARVSLLGSSCPVMHTYGTAAVGSLIAVVGSREVLEVSVRDGSAADTLGARRGDAVTVMPAD